MKRVKQFLAALFARISKEDVVFVSKYLDKKEQELFFAMSKIDQAHSLRVARTARKIAQKEAKKIDIPFLTRVALLHDVGRRKGDVGLFEKVFAVLLDDVCHSKLNDLASKGKDTKNPWHFLYVYKFHAQLGAELLCELGATKEATIIRHHHTKHLAQENTILDILCKADEEN